VEWGGLDLDAINWAELIAKITAGGMPSWIAAGVLILLVAGFYFWWKSKEKDLIDKGNQESEEKDHAGTVDRGQDAENQLNDGQDRVDEIRGQNPSEGKAESPPEV
jgi:hypothetical protein